MWQTVNLLFSCVVEAYQGIYNTGRFNSESKHLPQLTFSKVNQRRLEVVASLVSSSSLPTKSMKTDSKLMQNTIRWRSDRLSIWSQQHHLWSKQGSTSQLQCKKYTLDSVGKSYFITLLLTISYVVGHVLTQKMFYLSRFKESFLNLPVLYIPCVLYCVCLQFTSYKTLFCNWYITIIPLVGQS